MIYLQEANGELSLDTRTWSLKELFAQFSELYSWLNSIQEDIYGNETNTTDKALRAVSITRSFTLIFNIINNDLNFIYYYTPSKSRVLR